LAVGEVFTIPLTRNVSTGFDWEMKYDPAMVEYLGRDCRTPAPACPGDQSYCSYKFKALAQGETKITLLYQRGEKLGTDLTTGRSIIEMPVTIR